MKRGWKFREIASRAGAADGVFAPVWRGAASPGQTGPPAGPGGDAGKAHDSNAGQAGEGGQGTSTAAAPITRGRAHLSDRSAPAGCFRAHGPPNHPDHPDHPDQASSGACSARSGQPTPALTALPGRYPWTDDRAWIFATTHAADRPGAIALLAAWVAAAGGRLEGEMAWLPRLGPPARRRLAEVELRRMLRQFGFRAGDLDHGPSGTVRHAVTSPDAPVAPAELTARGEPPP
jgi:hypothetical protein